MVTRSQNAIVQLKARMREPLRARLETSAKRRGVPLNTELVDRVEQSFAKEDAFGGPEIANMARLMASAFLMGGQRGARARKHAKWTVAEWINDPFCYEAAVAAVVDALHAVQPMPYEPKQPKQEDQRVTLPFTATRDTTVFFDGDHLVLLREDGEKDQIPLVQQGEKELSE